MGNKKKEIVEKYLSRHYLDQNPVADNIEDILCKLNFKNHSLSVPLGWGLFYKETSSFDKFAAIYKDKKVLVKGDYPGFDVLNKDLSHIENIFNENWVSRKIREKSKGLMFAPFALYMVCLGVAGYDRYIDSTVVHKAADYLITLTKMDTYPQASGITAGITLGVGGSIFVDVAAYLINKHYASKLSDEAEGYDYGKEVENLLGRELLFEKAKSGGTTKQAFLEHFDKA